MCVYGSLIYNFFVLVCVCYIYLCFFWCFLISASSKISRLLSLFYLFLYSLKKNFIQFYFIYNLDKFSQTKNTNHIRSPYSLLNNVYSLRFLLGFSFVFFLLFNFLSIRILFQSVIYSLLLQFHFENLSFANAVLV